MIKAQEVETSIILSLYNGYNIESAKTHERQLPIIILLFFELAASLFKNRDLMMRSE